jgi:hypothetical protein
MIARPDPKFLRSSENGYNPNFIWNGKKTDGQVVGAGSYDIKLSLYYNENLILWSKYNRAIIIVEVEKVELGFQNSKMEAPKIIDPLDPPKNVRIGVIKGDSITFKAMLTPDITLEDENYIWSGQKTGTGAEISIIFNTTGNRNEFLSCLGVTRTATTTVFDIPPPNKYIWAILNPFTWPKVQSLGEEAYEWAMINQASLGGGIHNGRADAARHAYWNVLMASEINATDAEGASTAYERSNLEEGGPHNEIIMDMENNAAGRVIAGGLPPNPSRTVSQNAVISALNGGILTILDDLTNFNEVGLLQPSNQ